MKIEKLFPERWSEARAAWEQADPLLYGACPEEPVDRPILPMPSSFAALANSITHQQLAIAAGRAIGRRLHEATGGDLSGAAYLKLTEEQVRAVGLSQAK